MQVSKILLALIGAGLFAQASVADIQATTITNGSYKLESLEAAPSGTGQGKLTSCDFDPQGCADTTSGTTGGTTGVTTAGTTAGSTGRTAGATAEIPEPESLFLLIVGLIGLSRLRGRPVDRKFPVVNRSSRGDDAYSTERGE